MNPPPQAKTEFVYTVVAGGTPPNITLQLLTFDLNAQTGLVTQQSSSPWTGLNANFAVAPGSKFLYASSPLYEVNSYNLDPKTGVPSPSASLILNGGICGFGCVPPSAPGALSIDPNSKFLFYGSSTLGAVIEGVGSLAVNSSTGALSVVAGSPFTVNQPAFMVASHPSGKFLYTADLSSVIGGFTLQSVSGFSIDASSGALSPLPNSPYGVPANSRVLGLTIHPSGKFVYAPTGAAVGILGWSVDQSGALTPLSGSPFQAGVNAIGGSFDPTGKFLYLCGGAGGGILGYSVDSSSGSLTPLPGSPFAAGTTLGSPTVDPSGRFLLAGDFTNHAMAEFSLDSVTGVLTSAGSTATSGSPETFVIVPAP
jgi:6-phosphogluconolactonase (cycloisomerase 2 family)